MKCSKCGNELSENQGFCLKCGNPIQVDPDFNVIEAELASSVLELLEEEDKPSMEDPSEDDVAPMITVDVPYDEINMELKMVDITRTPSKPRVSRDMLRETEEEKAPRENSSKNGNPSNNKENLKKSSDNKKKKLIIAACTCGIIAIIGIVILTVLLLSDMKSKKTYDGNYNRALEASEEKSYDEAIEYCIKAISLSTSDKEEIAARILLDSIYRLNGGLTSDYASNLLELIDLGENSADNYVALVDYYYNNNQYTSINNLIVKIKDDDIFEALSKYLPEAPVAEQESGNYAGYVIVKLTATEGNKIYYTLNADGNSLNGGVEYREGVKILGEGSAKLTCFAVDANGIESKRTIFEYNITQGELNAPKVTPSSGSYSDFMTIEVEVPQGSTAYYTFDGTDPTKESKKYTDPIDMPRGTSKFKVIVFNEYDLPSAITTEAYNLNISRVISLADSKKLVEEELVKDEIMLEDGKTPYGTIEVTYDRIAIIGKDEYFIFLATESNDAGTVLAVTIYGVNTHDATINTEIINAEGGEYTLPGL